MKTLLPILGLVLASQMAFAGPCSDIKKNLSDKKGSCKALPKEQRKACHDEVKKIKEELMTCRKNAKASKGK